MSDTYRPGGRVPPETVMLLDRQYRVAFQGLTPWATPKGFAMYHDLGITTLDSARSELHAHKFRNDDRMAIWIESSPIGSEVWSKVSDA